MKLIHFHNFAIRNLSENDIISKNYRHIQITDKLTDKLIYKFILLDKAWTPRFCAGSKPTRVPEICDSKNVWQWSFLEIRLIALRLSTIPRKTIQFITVAYKFLKMIFQNQSLTHIYSLKTMFFNSFMTEVSIR